MTQQTVSILLALAGSTVWGVSDFLGGQQARRMPAIVVVAVTYPTGLILIGAIALVIGGSLPLEDAAVAVAAGVAGCAAIVLFYAGMAIGPVSILAPIASTGAAIPVGIGLIRGEAPSHAQAVGLVLAMVGIALAVREAEVPHAVRVPRRGLLFATLAAVGFGLFFFAIDGPSSENALWTSVWARAGGSLTILAALALRRPLTLSAVAALPILVLIGGLDAAANLLVAVASSKGLLTLVPVAASLFPVVTVLLARVVLGERLARTQQVGVVLALTGVVLIASG